MRHDQCCVCGGELGRFPRGLCCEPCWIARMRHDYGEEAARTAWGVCHPGEPYPTKSDKITIPEVSSGGVVVQPALF